MSRPVPDWSDLKFWVDTRHWYFHLWPYWSQSMELRAKSENKIEIEVTQLKISVDFIFLLKVYNLISKTSWDIV